MTLVGISGQAGSGKDTVADRLVTDHGFVKVGLADPLKRFGKEVFGFTEEQLWGPSEMRNALDDRYQLCEMRSSGVRFTPAVKIRSLRATCGGGWFNAAKALLEYGPEWLREVLPDQDPKEAMYLLCFWFESLGHHYANLSPRIMLQNLGTEWGRQHTDENIWVNCMLRAAEALEGDFQYNYDRCQGVIFRDRIDRPENRWIPAGVVVSDIRFANELMAVKNAGGKLVRIHRSGTKKKAERLGMVKHASEMEQRSFNDDVFDVVVQNDKSMDELLYYVDTVLLAALGGLTDGDES